jgi:signal transduction histidine kinase
VVTSNLYQLGTLVHVLVMSLGLALRLERLRDDKAAAERDAALSAQRSEEQRRFVAMLSHEFRNPLAAIDRSTQMIQIKADDLPQPHMQRLSQIRANVATLSGFVDNFLMTEMLDHSAVALSREPCALRPLLEAAIQQLGDEAIQRVRLHCPDDVTFSLDPSLISIAVGNLLGNALRYSPAGSPVEISAGLEDGGLRIRVADQGPGLDPESLQKLGTPYFRAPSSLGKKGSGLGYHFTRRIVETHGGMLNASSHAGGTGLAVEISLP